MYFDRHKTQVKEVEIQVRYVKNKVDAAKMVFLYNVWVLSSYGDFDGCDFKSGLSWVSFTVIYMSAISMAFYG